MAQKIKVKDKSKKLLGIFPQSKTFYQKNTGIMNPTNLVFSPKEYEGQNYDEKRKWAYEDAKNHKKFYKELIEKEVYPEGTKIKIKKMKHSDKYSLELTIPQVKSFEKLIWNSKENSKSVEEYNKKIADLKHQTFKNIVKSSKKYGYDYKHLIETPNGIVQNPEGEYNEDLFANRNYGYSKKFLKDPKIHYFDIHILHGKLPFKKRKFDPIENQIKFGNKRIKERLEEKLKMPFFIAITIGALFVISTNVDFTGNFIAETIKETNNIFLIILFGIGILGIYCTLRKKYH